MRLEEASGVYDCAAVITGRRGKVKVGAFTVLNGTYVICDDRVDIGAHCLLAWGAVITDNANPSDVPAATRRGALLAAAADPQRHPPSLGAASPVTIEDNVWVGFGSVILSVTVGSRVGIGWLRSTRDAAHARIRQAGRGFSVIWSPTIRMKSEHGRCRIIRADADRLVVLPQRYM